MPQEQCDIGQIGQKTVPYQQRTALGDGGDKSGYKIVCKCAGDLRKVVRNDGMVDGVHDLVSIAAGTDQVVPIPLPGERAYHRTQVVDLNAVIMIPKVGDAVRPSFSRGAFQVALIVADIINLKKEIPDVFVRDIPGVASLCRVDCHRSDKSGVAGMPCKLATQGIIIYEVQTKCAEQDADNAQQRQGGSFNTALVPDMTVQYAEGKHDQRDGHLFSGGDQQQGKQPAGNKC